VVGGVGFQLKQKHSAEYIPCPLSPPTRDGIVSGSTWITKRRGSSATSTPAPFQASTGIKIHTSSRCHRCGNCWRSSAICG
jgi:hypothetical protein